ncbi:hypothetical protein Tco_0404322 [Tanacetum coccineum]
MIGTTTGFKVKPTSSPTLLLTFLSTENGNEDIDSIAEIVNKRNRSMVPEVDSLEFSCAYGDKSISKLVLRKVSQIRKRDDTIVTGHVDVYTTKDCQKQNLQLPDDPSELYRISIDKEASIHEDFLPLRDVHMLTFCFQLINMCSNFCQEFSSSKA